MCRTYSKHNLLLTDVGHPGLSGSPVSLLSDPSKIVGMYTTRLTCSHSRVRESTIDGVVSRTFSEHRDVVERMARKDPVLRKLFPSRLCDEVLKQPRMHSSSKVTQLPSTNNLSIAQPPDGEMPSLIQSFDEAGGVHLEAGPEGEAKLVEHMLRQLHYSICHLGMKFESKINTLEMKFESKIDKIEGKIDSLGKKMESKFDTLGKKMENQFEMLSDVRNDFLQRRAVALPLAEVIRNARFAEWNSTSWRLRKTLEHVHVVDPRTGCDLGISW